MLLHVNYTVIRLTKKKNNTLEIFIILFGKLFGYNTLFNL